MKQLHIVRAAFSLLDSVEEIGELCLDMKDPSLSHEEICIASQHGYSFEQGRVH